MAPNDKSIWSRWLLQGGSQYAPFTYDVRVGDGVIMPPTDPAVTHKIAYALTTKRIDAIAMINDVWTIIEIRKRAGLSAIGALYGYGMLWSQNPPDSRRYQLWLVTDYLQPDMTNLLSDANIRAFEVGQ